MYVLLRELDHRGHIPTPPVRRRQPLPHVRPWSYVRQEHKLMYEASYIGTLYYTRYTCIWTIVLLSTFLLSTGAQTNFISRTQKASTRVSFLCSDRHSLCGTILLQLLQWGQYTQAFLFLCVESFIGIGFLHLISIHWFHVFEVGAWCVYIWLEA